MKIGSAGKGRTATVHGGDHICFESAKPSKASHGNQNAFGKAKGSATLKSDLGKNGFRPST